MDSFPEKVKLGQTPSGTISTSFLLYYSQTVYSLLKKIKVKFITIHHERLEILEFLYLVEKFLADIFQKFFDYDTKSESSRSESSEEGNTEESTQDSK